MSSENEVARFGHRGVSGEISVGVVICAYSSDRRNELVQAVLSVRDQTQPPDDVIVVIDHNDSLLTRAGVALAPVRVVASEGPPGLAGARNTGLRQLGTDIVAFMDDDACADRDWLGVLTSAFGAESVIGVGGWVEPRWESLEPRWLAPELYWVAGCSYRGLPANDRTLRNPIGANMAFRRDALLALGGFTEDIGQRPGTELRDDDTDLGIRLHALFPEGRLLHITGARVQHAVPADRVTWRYLVRRCWGEGRAKAQLARRYGDASALASERSYVARVLPAGIAGGALDAARRDPAGLARAASIIVALVVTVAGYGFGQLHSRQDRAQART